MRTFAALALLSSMSWWGWVYQSAERGARSTVGPPKRVEFSRDIRPIFERRCQPCHFPGGKMYARLPFDRAETIQMLGTKVFTRIKKDDERALIERFLAQKSRTAG